MRYKPDNAQKEQFKRDMDSLYQWLDGEGRKYGAERAATGTIYFSVNGQRYRVASHAPGVNYSGESCFFASPIRAPEICRELVAGQKLDKRGRVAA